VLTAHIILKDELPAEKLIELKKKLRDILVAEGIKHTTIEFETINNECIFGNCKER
jgi:Co/Zn/Cd efflux system component